MQIDSTFTNHTSNNAHPDILLQLTDVVKVYPSSSGGFKALNNINASFTSGEFVGILGKSGAGKSTLFNMITATDTITSGDVQVMGKSIHKMNNNQAARWRGQNLGVIFQSFRLMPPLSLVDNILIPVDFCGDFNGARSREWALELLRAMDLEIHANKMPSAISGGQQQRVAIARALANDPPILIADEPTGRLDSGTADMIYNIFEDLAREGKLVLMATHDISSQHRFTRRLTINDGCLVEDTGIPMKETAI